MFRFRRTHAAIAGGAVALMAAGSAVAFQALPQGVQVNNDPAAGIDPGLSVGAEDPTNADVVGGALTAGKVAVPWAIFRQSTAGQDQVFVRSFASGAWTTRGNGTVGGRSSASPTFSGSLNFDQSRDGEAPAIDFAGAGRTVPWATWYETTTGSGFANNNIFASRFDNTGDATQGKWIFAGQSRGNGGSGPNVPSLNIHTDQDAENPAVAGGSAIDPTKPGPWITWQETTSAPVGGTDEIFVVKPLGPGQTNCDGVTPAGVPVAGHVPSIGGFCWQQVGLPRVGPSAADPSLNVDPTRNGVEPDIAFTGPNDSVPWIVWYEEDASNLTGLHSNELVFAAKGVADAAAQGGFHWLAVGSQLQGTLDTTGTTNHFGTCAESATNEGQCSLNKNPANDAEDPQVAAGTMNPANPTVPWVTWDETLAGVNQVFVSRLVGTGATAHFELANNGAPISVGANPSTRADITFSGNTPYVSWREDIGGGVVKAFVGHFVNAANPTFVLDESDVPLTPTAQVDVREPISSACIATPFNKDGAACQGGAIGTPFFLYTNGSGPFGLFADAYQPGAPVTGASAAVTSSSATVSGTVNPVGAAVRVLFQFGTSAAYGQTTAAQTVGVANAPTSFSAGLSGLPAAKTIHYRAVVVSDFGAFAGGDQTLKTAAPPPGAVSVGTANVSGTAAKLRAKCVGAADAKCSLSLKLTVSETVKRRRHHTTHTTVTVGTAKATLSAGQTATVKISLNGTGKRLLRHHNPLQTTLRVTEAHTSKVATQTVTFTH